MKVNVVNPQAWMLTSVDEGRRQLARCAFAAGLSRGRMDAYEIPVPNHDSAWEGCPDELVPFEGCKHQGLEEAEALVSRLLNMKPHPHATVIEHSAISFLIRCSRIGSHEIVRHRLAAITQESTRYCMEGKDGAVTFIRPLDRPESDVGEYPGGHAAFEVPDWVEHGLSSVEAYKKELAAGRKREFARYLLPHHIEVWMAFTANFREWQHVLRMRTQKAAAPEMRLIFGQVQEQLAKISPVLVEGV